MTTLIQAAEQTLKPDYSWVPDELGAYVGGVLASLTLVSGIVFMVLLVRASFSKKTATLVDNPQGIKAVIAAFLSTLLLAGLTAGVQWGNDLYGSQGISQTVATSPTGSGDLLPVAGSETFDAAGAAGDEAKANFGRSGQAWKDAWGKLTHGDLAGAAKDSGTGIGQAASGIGNGIKSGLQWTWGGIQYAWDDPGAAMDSVKSWAGDKARAGMDWITSLFKG
jgi:hypothetical protein